MIDALCDLRRKSLEAGAVTAAMGFFRSNHQRMRYRQARDTESPISDGAVKAANKMIVNTRLKHWGRASG